MASSNTLYLFVDESGNFDFSENGSKYFCLTYAAAQRPFAFYPDFSDYRYDVIEGDLTTQDKSPQGFFHCSYDNASIRKDVFDIIAKHLPCIEVGSVITPKSVIPAASRDTREFYSEMLGYLISFAVRNYLNQGVDKIIIITDSIPTHQKRSAVEKSIRIVLKRVLASKRFSYKIFHHQSSSHYGLQVVDYCSWCIFKKYTSGHEGEYYQLIKPAIKNELFLSSWVIPQQ